MSRISGIQQLLQQQSLGNQGRQGQLAALLPQLIAALSAQRSQAFQQGTGNLVDIERQAQANKQGQLDRFGAGLRQAGGSVAQGLQAKGQRKFEAGENKADRDAAQKRAETRAKPKTDGDDDKKINAMNALKNAMRDRPEGGDDALAMSLLLKGREAIEAGNYELAEAYAFSIEFGVPIKDSASTANVNLPPEKKEPPPPPGAPPTGFSAAIGEIGKRTFGKEGIDVAGGLGTAGKAVGALGSQSTVGLANLLGANLEQSPESVDALTRFGEMFGAPQADRGSNARLLTDLIGAIFNPQPTGGANNSNTPLPADAPPLANPISDRFNNAISNPSPAGPGGGPPGLPNQQALPPGIGDIKTVDELIAELKEKLLRQQQNPSFLQQRGP